MSEGLRLFVALGPGDIVGARRAQLAGTAIGETSIAFSEQLFAYCRLRGIRTLAISSNDRADALEEGLVRIQNRAKPLAGRADRADIRFHLSLILYGFYLAVRARRFGADVAVIDSGTTHYFALIFFRLLGIPVLVNLHNVLWPRGFPPQGKLQRFLNSVFFRYACSGAIGVSPECERQIALESHGKVPFFQYRCQFKLAGFRTLPRHTTEIFRIAFVGRAESNKGVLDIPRMLHGLRARAPGKVIFEVCGDGPALPELKSIVADQRLGDEIVVHGRLEREALLEVYARSDAVIVPTRSNFTEGMPQVCAEAVLAGIPVVTSEVANAFDVIGPATVNARTDDVESYVNTIVSLIDDPALYERLRAACPALALQFLDRAQSYPAALDRLLQLVIGQRALPEYANVFKEIA